MLSILRHLCLSTGIFALITLQLATSFSIFPTTRNGKWQTDKSILSAARGSFDFPDSPTYAQFDDYDDSEYSGSYCMLDVPCRDDEECLKGSMRRQLDYALSNMKPYERDLILQRIWASDTAPISSIRLKLIDLTRLAEGIENECLERNDLFYGYDDLRDKIQSVHNRMATLCRKPALVQGMHIERLTVGATHMNQCARNSAGFLHKMIEGTLGFCGRIFKS